MMKLWLTAAFQANLVTVIEQEWADPTSLSAKNVRSMPGNTRSAMALVADIGGVIGLHSNGQFEIFPYNTRKRNSSAALNVLTPSTLGFAISNAADQGASALAQLLPSCRNVHRCVVCRGARAKPVVRYQDQMRDSLSAACPLCQYWTTEVQARYVNQRDYERHGITPDLTKFTAGCICMGHRRLALEHYPSGIACARRESPHGDACTTQDDTSQVVVPIVAQYQQGLWTVAEVLGRLVDLAPRHDLEGVIAALPAELRVRLSTRLLELAGSRPPYILVGDATYSWRHEPDPSEHATRLAELDEHEQRELRRFETLVLPAVRDWAARRARRQG